MASIWQRCTNLVAPVRSPGLTRQPPRQLWCCWQKQIMPSGPTLGDAQKQSLPPLKNLRVTSWVLSQIKDNQVATLTRNSLFLLHNIKWSWFLHKKLTVNDTYKALFSTWMVQKSTIQEPFIHSQTSGLLQPCEALLNPIESHSRKMSYPRTYLYPMT